jgi:dihydroorotate dehydrogenase electron transfer subunit
LNGIMPVDLSLRIESMESLGASHYLLTLLSDVSLPDWQAGQFAMISVGQHSDTIDPLLRRPFSIYNLPDETPGESRTLQILIKVLGRGSALLSRSRTGDKVRCLAPLGNGFSPERAPGSRLLLVAGGIGAASLHPLALREIRSGGVPVMLYGCRTRDDLAGIGPTLSAGIEVRLRSDADAEVHL